MTWWLPYVFVVVVSVITPLVMGTTWKRKIIGVVFFLLFSALCFIPDPSPQMSVNTRHIDPPARFWKNPPVP